MTLTNLLRSNPTIQHIALAAFDDDVHNEYQRLLR